VRPLDREHISQIRHRVSRKGYDENAARAERGDADGTGPATAPGRLRIWNVDALFETKTSVGVPTINPPGLRLIPAGNEPEIRLHTYGVEPPVARSCLENVLPTVPIPSGELLIMVSDPGPPPVAG